MCAGVGYAIPACVRYCPSPADSLRLNRFTLQSVVSDENLWKEIDDHEDIVTCSFRVCGDELQIRRISVQKMGVFPTSGREVRMPTGDVAQWDREWIYQTTTLTPHLRI
jgi:hypothetical protein